nr:hypothetical protein CFP56_72679 [Quercus suber]
MAEFPSFIHLSASLLPPFFLCKRNSQRQSAPSCSSGRRDPLEKRNDRFRWSFSLSLKHMIFPGHGIPFSDPTWSLGEFQRHVDRRSCLTSPEPLAFDGARLCARIFRVGTVRTVAASPPP